MAAFGGYLLDFGGNLYTGCALAGGGDFYLEEIKAAGIFMVIRQSIEQWLYAKIAVIVGKCNIWRKERAAL